MTPADLAAIRDRATRAGQELDRLCKGGRFTMTVPAKHDDSDLTLSAVIQDAGNMADHIEALEKDRREFAEALGFSHGYGEPAPLSEIFDSVQVWEQESRDHFECPVTCEQCGETLAATICEHCNGSGDNSSLAGYAECEWCGGAGKVHDCAEVSYADLVADRNNLQARIDQALKLLSEWEHPGTTGPFPDRVVLDVDEEVIRPLRQALTGTTPPHETHIPYLDAD